MEERTTYDERGLLDEVVVTGGAHLERMSGGDKRGRWFLSMQRADGSEFCLWFHGELAMTEERPAPMCRRCGGPMRPGLAIGQTATPGVPDFPGDREASTYSVGGPGKLMTCMKCPECGWSVTSAKGE